MGGDFHEAHDDGVDDGGQQGIGGEFPAHECPAQAEQAHARHGGDDRQTDGQEALDRQGDAAGAAQHKVLGHDERADGKGQHGVAHQRI